jgi:hypothetical protein
MRRCGRKRRGYRSSDPIRRGDLLKSFRLYRKPPKIAPERVATGHQLEEMTRFREEFLRIVKRHQRYQYLALGSFFVGICCFVLSKTHPSVSSWLIAGCFVCALGYTLAVQLSRPKCPACHNALDGSFGAYCPECGAGTFPRSNWLYPPTCLSCGTTMRRGRKGSRKYRIRACTHCGVFLDTKGL